MIAQEIERNNYILLIFRLEVAKSFQNDNYKIVSYNVNKGKGGAVRIGMLIAVGRVQLFMDADLATDINDYPRCFNEINKI